MKIKTNTLFLGFAIMLFVCLINSCSTTSQMAAKTGSELWGENCVRCHNAPSSADFSNEQWAVIGMHMKLRANLTDDEIKKVVVFLSN
jgi:hypothetical protein